MHGFSKGAEASWKTGVGTCEARPAEDLLMWGKGAAWFTLPTAMPSGRHRIHVNWTAKRLNTLILNERRVVERGDISAHHLSWVDLPTHA